MEDLELYEEIRNAKDNNDVLLDLVTRFTPLWKKYASMLQYEDAYFDLQLDFIELLCNFNTDKMKRKDNRALLSYIKKSVYNNYIKRSKLQKEYCINNRLFSDISEEQFAVISLRFATTDTYEALKLMEYQRFLTQQEFEVIIMIYYYGYSVSEIAGMKYVSRQAINQIKIWALSKLHRQLADTSVKLPAHENVYKDSSMLWHGKTKNKKSY